MILPLIAFFFYSRRHSRIFECRMYFPPQGGSYSPPPFPSPLGFPSPIPVEGCSSSDCADVWLLSLFSVASAHFENFLLMTEKLLSPPPPSTKFLSCRYPPFQARSSILQKLFPSPPHFSFRGRFSLSSIPHEDFMK